MFALCTHIHTQTRNTHACIGGKRAHKKHPHCNDGLMISIDLVMNLFTNPEHQYSHLLHCWALNENCSNVLMKIWVPLHFALSTFYFTIIITFFFAIAAIVLPLLSRLSAFDYLKKNSILQLIVSILILRNITKKIILARRKNITRGS